MLKLQRNRKGQSAMELFILVGAMMFIFIVLLGIFQQSVSRKTNEKRDEAFNELAINVANEFNIAASASDGYSRTFQVPENVLGLDYDISIVSSSVYIISEDEKHALSLTVQNVTGSINKGDNVIQKVNGEILLNQ